MKKLKRIIVFIVALTALLSVTVLAIDYSQYNKHIMYQFTANGQKLDSSPAQKPDDGDPYVYVTPTRVHGDPYQQEWVSTVFTKGGTLYARSRLNDSARTAASNLLTMTGYKGASGNEQPYSTSYLSGMARYNNYYVLRCEIEGVAGSAVQWLTWCP